MPFGSQSHGHNPQNSFQLNAYGEALFVANGYRDLHGSKFHYQWVHSTRAQNAMAQLASATGGTAFVPEKIENLEAVFSRIASELRAQYLLQYYSNNKSGNAAFRRIAVNTPGQPQLRVRAREGYYPKAK